MCVIRLKSGREKSVLRFHPWIFSGAIDEVQGAPENGETTRVIDTHGNFLAWGAFSLKSQIRVRIWSWDPDELVNEDFLWKRLSDAINRRNSLFELNGSNAFRLIYAESDNIPGVIMDRYDDTLVIQYLSSGAEFWRDQIAEISMEITGANRIYERSDVDVRILEGLEERMGLLLGPQPPEFQRILENGLKFLVDIRNGHKTGFYLDQRQNRELIRAFTNGKQVLDCFCYSGGFSTNALVGGAESVVAVDSSDESIHLGRKNLEENNLPQGRVEWVKGNVFHVLRKFRDQGLEFDVIILDPPKFAQTSSQAGKAARGYKDINLLAFKLLRGGGTLITFSCSGGIEASLFQKIVAGAAVDAKVTAQIIQRLHQGMDHPVGLNFPEGEYLKGLVVRVEK